MRLWVLLAFIFRRQLKLDAARRYALLVRPAVENVLNCKRSYCFDSLSFAMTSSRLKLAAFCRCG